MTDTQRVILLMVILLLIAILFGTAGWAKWRRRRGRPVAELLHTDTDSGHPTTVVRGLHDQWSVTLMLAVCAGMFAAFAVFVWDCSCRKPHPYRSGRMFVFVQDASKPIAASDPKLGYVVGISDWGGQWVQGSGVSETLVRSVAIVEAVEFVQGVKQVSLVPDQGSVQQFAAAGSHPAFHDRVHAGCLDTIAHDFDTRVGEHGVKQRRELAIPVADEVSGFGSGVFEVHDEIPRRLCHPGT